MCQEFKMHSGHFQFLFKCIFTLFPVTLFNVSHTGLSFHKIRSFEWQNLSMGSFQLEAFIVNAKKCIGLCGS